MASNNVLSDMALSYGPIKIFISSKQEKNPSLGVTSIEMIFYSHLVI